MRSRRGCRHPPDPSGRDVLWLPALITGTGRPCAASHADNRHRHPASISAAPAVRAVTFLVSPGRNARNGRRFRAFRPGDTDDVTAEGSHVGMIAEGLRVGMMPAGRVAAKLHAELHAGMMRPSMRRGAGRDAADGMAAGAECRDDADGFTPKGGSRCRDAAAGPACRTCGGRRAATGAADRHDAAGARGGQGPRPAGRAELCRFCFSLVSFQVSKPLSHAFHSKAWRGAVPRGARIHRGAAPYDPCVRQGVALCRDGGLATGRADAAEGGFLSFPMPGGAAYGARNAAALHLVQYR